MKKKIVTILLFTAIAGLSSFILSGTITSPQQQFNNWYADNYKLLSRQVQVLKTAIEKNEPEKNIHTHFLNARLAYKKIEFLVEYYCELDVNKINGPPINFIEEEDPTAYQEPQGFQVIESYIFPQYDIANRQPLLQSVDKLLELTTGLSNNASNFQADEFVVDAAMEELYRIITLGITGFDSPLALYSLREATSSLNSIQFVIQVYEKEITALDKNGYTTLLNLLTSAQQYLQQHNNFNRFDRLEFITRYINPACDILGNFGKQTGTTKNKARKYVIEKQGSLFDPNAIKQTSFLRDDVLTAEKITLGRKLFYDPVLSANGKRSCAGCHKPGSGFTDGLPKAMDIDEHSKLPRNTPTLWNACLQRNLFADSRQVSLDHLIVEVLSNEKEMNSGADNAAKKINANREYKTLFQKAYPAEDHITGKNMVNAISMFLYTLTSYNSRFDEYIRGQKEKLTAQEKQGFNLFMGKARCGTCHFAPFFNGSKPPAFYYQESEVLGVPATTDTLHAVLDADEGRYVATGKDFHKHAFKTPTLRNIAITAPYMHNGVYTTLEEVLDFYNKGGGEGLHIAPENLTLLPNKLELTKPEMAAVVAFLKTLTDTSALKN